MIEIVNDLDWTRNSDLIMALLSVYPGAYFKTRTQIENEPKYLLSQPDLEHLANKGVSEKVISDQILVSNRVDDVLSGFRSKVEDYLSSFLEKRISGSSRHSLALICSYGDGSPLNDLELGRYPGNDVIKGKPIDLMGNDGDVRGILREVRNREGIGSLVINGHYSLCHTGIQLRPAFNFGNGEYSDTVDVGSRTGAMIELSRAHPTYSRNPIWFYKLNGERSIIQNGKEYILHENK